MTKGLKHNRRQFLMGAGGFMLSIPFLTSLAPSSVLGSDAKRVSRFVSILRRDGAPLDFWPSGIDYNSLNVLGPTARDLDLSNISGNLSACFGDKYNDLKEHMLILRCINGMEYRSGHETFPFLTATRSKYTPDFGENESIDQHIIRKIYDSTSPVEKQLNIVTSWSNKRGSYSRYKKSDGSYSVMGAYHFPKDIFNNFFGGAPEGGADAKADEKLVIDRVFNHLKSVKNNRRISLKDKERLGQFSEEIFQLQTKLGQETKINSCSKPSSISNGVDLVERIQNTFKVMELVLKCDITRVINYDFNPDTKIAPYFGGIGHHGISHSSSFDGMKLFGEMHKWHHDFLADFIKTLKDEDPLNPGKSYLENTLIFMSNELGSQSNSNGNGYDNNHLRIDIPTVLIGNVNDYFKTGRYIDYRNSNEPRNGRWWRPVGHPYNQVLQTVMSAYGVTYQDWEQDGIVGYGDYRGMHYGKSFPDIMSLGDKRSPLPGIKA